MSEVQKNRLRFLVCCDHHVKDDQGKTSIIGIFRALFSDQLPVNATRFFIVAEIENVVGAQISGICKHSDGTNIMGWEFPTEQKVDNTFHNLVIAVQVENVQFPKYGQYVCIISIDGDEIGQITIDVLNRNPSIIKGEV